MSNRCEKYRKKSNDIQEVCRKINKEEGMQGKDKNKVIEEQGGNYAAEFIIESCKEG